MHPLTSFIGRDKEFADIQQLLIQPACRLLTLVGPGGSGKTRLALQLAQQNEEKFAYGTAVVTLQSLRSAEFFVPTIADALNISLSGQDPPLVQLGHYLGDKELLIILDNFEHILDAADQLLALLTAAAHTKFLVTSREALNLQEEWLYPLTGLAFPTEAVEQADIKNYDALQLFMERAWRVYPGFSPTAETKAMVRICQLVEGLPLALELAAAWRRSLDCEAIAAEIQRDLEFLSTRLRNVPERHRSIQAIFDQTWQRLTQKEQAVFIRLSVFRGGFGREAAAEVARASLPILSDLVDKSLLRVDENGRYQIHELLRQYAAEKLAENADDVQQTQTNHAAYYINYLHVRQLDISNRRQREALSEIKIELDNIRVAWLWVVAQADSISIQKAGDTLGYYYQFTGNYLEGLRLFSQATEVLQAQPPGDDVDLALIRTVTYQSWYHLRFGHFEETEEGMKQVQAIYQRLEMPPLPNLSTDPVTFLSLVALIRGDYETAEQYAEQARQAAEINQQPSNFYFACHVLSDVYLGQGKIETAHEFSRQAYASAQSVGDQWFLAYVLNNLGQIAVILGDNATAKTHFQQSYKIRQAFNDPEGMALASNNLANIALQEQDFAEAASRYQDSYSIYQDINDNGGLAAANKGLGVVALKQGHYQAAQGYLHEALKIGLEINFRTFLLTLLVDIAELFWHMGDRKRPFTLLTFTANHPAAEHETRNTARKQLDLYKLAVPPSLFAKATQPDETANLNSLCTRLLYELSLPYSPSSETDTSQTAVTPDQPLFDPLTPRELEVLQLIANGRSNPEIADELILSVGTVKSYTNKIFSKLGVRNRVEAVTRARELNLV